jgi:FAD/FMN-containing dehydrogenase
LLEAVRINERRFCRRSDNTMSDIAIAALMEPDIEGLKAGLRGELVRPGDENYDEARKVYNAMHDRRPALIVRAAGAADAIAAVRFAGEHDLLLAVRGGGHSIPGFGTCNDGLVLDLGRMRGMRVDPERRTVRAEGGCTWGDLNHATNAFGLATTGGIVSTTGIAGLTLGGGLGYLARSCGLTCDNLISADVVTADGNFVTCSEERNEALFWALRGGGGNFGVATSFEYRLHPVADILGGPTFFPLNGDVLRGYRDLMSEAPEELGALLGLALAPPAPFIPEEWHGKPVCVVLVCWTGPTGEGEKILKTFETWAPVIGQAVGRMPYPSINTLFDELLPPGLHHYWKGHFVRGLPDEAIEAHLEYGSTIPSVETATLLFPIDGACHRVAPEETAFAYRDADFAVGLGPSWPNPADTAANIEWGRRYSEALAPYAEEGGYVNFMSGDDQVRVRANYRRNYDRLAEIKRRYDPDNLFRMNQNIAPPGSEASGRGEHDR